MDLKQILSLELDGCERFLSLIPSNYQAKIIAMICRHSDPENPYEQNNKQDQWWLPVIELLLKNEIQSNE